MNPRLLKLKIAAGVSALLLSSSVFCAGQVSSVLISEIPATPFSYTAEGVQYNWGGGNNQILEGFTVDGRTFAYAMSANEVVIQRDDIIGVSTGEPCGIFVEELTRSDGSRTYAADFPHDGSEEGNCELEQLLESRIVNRGLLDTFSNVFPVAKNIERLDYLFYFGALAPLSADQLPLAGHLVAEKRGNNPVKMAAIVSLDVFGQPDQYGPMVLVSAAGCAGTDVCYGATDLVHAYSFLQNEFDSPQGLPVETRRSNEAVNMAFVSAEQLGLRPGQRYFGVSIFADDVDADLHDLVDPRTFPNNTSDDFITLGDDADIYGGLTGYFLGDDMNVVSGKLFLDVDGDGVPDANEAGISDISVLLYQDTNGNGIIDSGVDTLLGDPAVSNTTGEFFFPGLSNGNYLVQLDEKDPEIPGGLAVTPGINPYPLTVTGIDPEPVYFAFVSVGGPGDPNDPNDPGGAPNDDATQAVADTFVVLIGNTEIFDVLANDIDGAGDGLELLSVSSSLNSTISTTDDNRVRYIPNYGYFSPEGMPDTFTYTMQDSDGTNRTGNVSVTVIRSDINNNLVDDFAECNCDDLTLITGVDGRGVGYPSSLLLLALAMLSAWRFIPMLLSWSSPAKREW